MRCRKFAEIAAYEPRRRDWQHLNALLELLEERGRISDSAIGVKLHVSHTAVWRWRQRPGFETWLNSQLQARTQHWKTFVLARAFALAMRGSIKHMDFLARVLGWYKQPEGGSEPTINVIFGPGLRARD
ncbi:MAG: hypothetical protein GEV06_09395 [Luteitalea sp.]|nr:hypothetical protein [Luteitalea sp.]